MKPLILIVEDDSQIRRFLRASLAAEGYRLHESLTADDGLAQAAARQPDLILLDISLPNFILDVAGQPGRRPRRAAA